MPPKKRSYQTRSAKPAKRPRLSHGTESRQGSRQENSSQQLEPTQEHLMTVNMTALSATISSSVKEAANASITACFTEDEMVADGAVILTVIKCS